MSEHDDVVDELLGDDTAEETQDVSEKEVTRLTANSVYSYVENIVNMPVFFFNFGDPTVSAGARGMVLEGYIPSEDSAYYSLKQLVTKPEFILGVSTDKAAKVAGVYGATKLLMERDILYLTLGL